MVSWGKSAATRRKPIEARPDKISIDQDPPSGWDSFVDAHPYGTIYHTVGWTRAIQKAYGHRPYYISVGDGGGLRAALPVVLIRSPFRKTRLTSLPCAQTCNPLAETQELSSLLVGGLLDLAREYGANHAELKTTSSYAPVIEASATREYCIHELDLRIPLAGLFSSFHKSCIQRNIKKIERSPVELRAGRSLEDVGIFYSLYLGMRKGYGLLPQPYVFFKALWETFSPTNQIRIWHAVYEGEFVASILLLDFKKTVTYEYGASRDRRISISPIIFLLWESIKQAQASGYEHFNFGRTDLDNAGLMEFKGRWGTVKEDLVYYDLHQAGAGKDIRRNQDAASLMRLIVHHSPPYLCRILGRIIYKHIV
jgi:serine/alanine adding enzyme